MDRPLYVVTWTRIWKRRWAVAAGSLAPTSSAEETRNAGIAFQPAIRHDPIAIELHDKAPEARGKRSAGNRTTAGCENQHATA
jgi:hypothetical protein